MSSGRLCNFPPSQPKRRADLNIDWSEFEIPPMQDVLLVGRRAPVGPEAVTRMVNAVSPGQYEVIRLNQDVFEAAVLKKSLLKLVPKEKLLEVVLEEGTRIATEKSVVKAKVNVVIHTTRLVDL